MSTTPALASILSELPLARGLLAPLRDVREKEWGEPLPPVAFPIPAFVTEELPRPQAWELFRELRSDARLSSVAVVVASPEAEILATLWEKACPAAERLLSLRTSTAEPEASRLVRLAREWVESPTGLRAIARRAHGARGGKGAAPAEALRLDPVLSQRFVDDRERDVRCVYVLDVEPWASPLALTWLLTAEAWGTRVATMRRWHAAHGFSVVALGVDMLDARVERPPTTEPEIAACAVESVAFCDGYLDEGFAPVVEMVTGNNWRFRFDI